MPLLSCQIHPDSIFHSTNPTLSLYIYLSIQCVDDITWANSVINTNNPVFYDYPNPLTKLFYGIFSQKPHSHKHCDLI